MVHAAFTGGIVGEDLRGLLLMEPEVWVPISSPKPSGPWIKVALDITKQYTVALQRAVLVIKSTSLLSQGAVNIEYDIIFHHCIAADAHHVLRSTRANGSGQWDSVYIGGIPCLQLNVESSR